MSDRQQQKGCRWIYGDPDSRRPSEANWHYCQAPTINGTHWCEEHYSQVYTRKLKSD